MYLLPLDQHVRWHQAAVAAAKRAVYEGFQAAADCLPPGQAGILIDERSGASILRDAAARGFTTGCAVGAMRDTGFDIDDAGAVAAHAATCTAAYWRAVVCYNPDGDRALNEGEAVRLQRLSDELRRRSRPRLMCDLVVPPTERQLVRGIRAYGRDLLPALTGRAIAQLLDAGVEPDVWVIEGFVRPDDYRSVVAAMRSGRNTRCFVRAAGHGDDTTCELMTAGLSVPGVGGVVLGRAPFWQPVVAWMSGRSTRAAAVAAVASQFRAWVGLLGPRRAYAV